MRWLAVYPLLGAIGMGCFALGFLLRGDWVSALCAVAFGGGLMICALERRSGG